MSTKILWRALVAFALATSMAPTGAHADTAPVRSTVIAGPIAASVGYTTRAIVVIAGDGADFVNADSVYHNVESDDFDTNGHALFRSALTGDTIGTARRYEIVGVESLPPGTYGFHCTPHSGTMKGTLIIEAGGTSP